MGYGIPGNITMAQIGTDFVTRGLTTKTGQLPGQASWHEMLVQTVSGDGSREAWARFLLHKTRTSERCQSLGQILIVQYYST